MAEKIFLKRGKGSLEENIETLHRWLWTNSGDGSGLSDERVFRDKKALKPNWMRLLLELAGRELISFAIPERGLPSVIYLRVAPAEEKEEKDAKGEQEKRERSKEEEEKTEQTSFSLSAEDERELFSLLKTSTRHEKEVFIPEEEAGEIVQEQAPSCPDTLAPSEALCEDYFPSAGIFVDVANITMRPVPENDKEPEDGNQQNENGNKTTRCKLIQWSDIIWPVLHLYLAKGFRKQNEFSVEYANAYQYFENENGVERRLFEESIGKGMFDAIFHNKGNVDALLSADIVYFGMRELEAGNNVQIILLSGDSDFIHAVKRLMEEAAKRQRRVHVWVISWKKALSMQWRMFQREHKGRCYITYLENVPHIFSRRAQENIKLVS